MEDFNLHLTGDVHAIGAAHNLGGGVPRQPPPPRQRARHRPARRSSGRASSTSATARCARSSSGSAARENGYPRETEFVITVASEVMAVLALASDLHDLRARLGRIVLATTTRRHAGHRRGPQGRRRDDRAPARRDQAEPAPDARGRAGVRPLRAVREHRPRQQLDPRRPARARDERHRLHRGGLRRRHGRREVLRHQVPRVGPAPGRGRRRRHDPGAQDARRRRQDRRRQAARPGAARGERRGGPAGGANLAKQIENVALFGVPVGRRDQLVPDRHAGRGRGGPRGRAGRRRARRGRRHATSPTAARAPTDLAAGGLGRGRGGRARLPAALPGRRAARRRRSRRSRPRSTAPTASTSLPAAAKQLAQYEALGFGQLPICMAKTQYSLSHDADAQGPPDRLPRADPRGPAVGRRRLRHAARAARCGRCRACRRGRAARRSTSTPTGTSSGCSRPARAAAGAAGGRLRPARSSRGRSRTPIDEAERDAEERRRPRPRRRSGRALRRRGRGRRARGRRRGRRSRDGRPRRRGRERRRRAGCVIVGSDLRPAFWQTIDASAALDSPR